jgi:hypothetical protein
MVAALGGFGALKVWGWRLAGVAAIAAPLAGCLGEEGVLPSFAGPREGATVNNNQNKDSEKIVKLPARPEDLDCPDVDVFPGGATARVGGPANEAVRYQFNVSNIARECDPQGNMFALKVGVAGQLLIGPAGKPGAYSTTLRVQVKRDIDNKVLFDKSYRVAADTNGGDQGSYKIVADPVMLPLTRARLDLDYSVTVGLGAGAPAESHHRRRSHHDG